MDVNALPDTLVLWDVDHTLIENGGVSKDTYALAFELIAGRPSAVRPVTHGRTDFQIMYDLLADNGVAVDDYRSISQFEPFLVQAMAKCGPELPKRGYVLPGVVEALTALADNPKIIQSALTGNIASNAHAKISPFGLTKWVDLDVGGFGSDGHIRSSLVAAAQTKVLAKYGRSFDRMSIILIGDTPTDVQAARDGDAKIIAVATGVHTLDELAALNPDAALPDLSDLPTFLDTLATVRAAPPYA